MAQKLLFFTGFVANWREVGCPFPSSCHVAERICSSIDFSKARTIIEIGGGTGVITRKILSSLHPDGSLTVFEVNPDFCNALRDVGDSRLIVHNMSAFQMGSIIQSKAQYVISGIPVATLPDQEFNRFHEAIERVLEPAGTFIQVQLAPLSLRRIKRCFSEVKLSVILRNIPPACMYSCRNPKSRVFRIVGEQTVGPF